jgi:hypothetical protein
MIRLGVVAGALALAPMAAEAQCNPYTGNCRGPGPAIVGGVVGGLVGGLAAGALLAPRGPVYAAPAPVYVEPPVYAAPPPRYVPTCFLERRRVWLDDYTYTYRRVRVCE